MAAVLGAFASKLAFIMMGMAKEKVEMLLGVPGEITKLQTTMGDLSRILADADRTRIQGSATEGWVRELKDAMYDADDILDLCQIMECGEDPTTTTAATPKTISRRWNIQKFFCFRHPVVAHEIGKKIQALNKRLLDISERSSRFGFLIQQINSSSGHSTNTAATSSLLHCNRMTGPSIIKSAIVGEKIEQDTKKIVDLLLVKVDTRVEENTVVAAAITGAGGIGKTTLARMVYNNTSVAEHFDKMIWLSVTKEVSEIGMMQRVIAAFGASYDGLAGDIALMENVLKMLVRQKKFLLVMDDMWTEKVWNDLLRVPLNGGASGSRVLVTTRDEKVACRMNAHHLHRIDKLEAEDGWILLKKQVYSLSHETFSVKSETIMEIR
ncbi:hypothetical protein QOZ80_3AG0220980 [Eleusine coracana subsp. coracana]|nr:hypothetical protein QOZ80_3AG0220980 [Eleusine coracana subsp. coracana]